MRQQKKVFWTGYFLLLVWEKLYIRKFSFCQGRFSLKKIDIDNSEEYFLSKMLKFYCGLKFLEYFENMIRLSWLEM